MPCDRMIALSFAQSRLSTLSLPELENLSEALLDFMSMDDLQT
jgi:hypothetical protein